MTGSDHCANCGATLAPSAKGCAHCALTIGDSWGKWRRSRADEIQTPGGDDVMEELSEVLAPSIEVISPLGAGGMGLVYLAHDKVLKRLVAVKVLSPVFATEETARARFTREVEAIAAITHPHVVSIYQVGELPRLQAPYFLMQYVEGTTLRAEVRPGEIVPEAKVRRIVGEVAMALSAAHARGLVHRDIKPANIMLERESGRALVVDFGISATVASNRGNTSQRLSTQGMFVGTPAYMSPEQASGEDVTRASDIYSLGIVAFELLTGRLPFTGRSTMELMASHGSDQPAPEIRTLRPELHPQLAELIDRALRKNAAERPSADEIARLLFAAARSYVEWPPPGLGQLRALGARLSQTLAVAEGTGLLFFLLLMLQPAIASLRWHEGESSAFWNLVLSPNAHLRSLFNGTGLEAEQLAVDAAPIWAFLLTLCVVVMSACIPFVIGRAWHLAYRVRWARQSGYPWKVIYAVGWDYRRETGALLNGTGIYALLTRKERRRLVRLRWIEQVSGAVGLLLGALTPLLWFVTSPLRSSPRSGHLISPNEALFVIAPPLLALLILMICKRPESRHRSRMLRQRVFMARRLAPLVRPELVSSWLKSVRLQAASPPWMPAAASASLPIAMVFAATGVVAALFISALPPLFATARARGPAVAWVHSFDVDSLRPLRWQDLDRMLPERPVGRAASPDAASRARSLLMVHPASLSSRDSAARTAPPDIRLARILSRPRMLLSGAERDRLVQDTTRFEVAEWRRVARAAPFAPSWYAEQSRIPARRPYDLLRRHRALRQVAAINATSALLPLQAGDTAEFRRRIAENISLGTELLRTPFPGLQTVALDILLEARGIARVANLELNGTGRSDAGVVLDTTLRAAKADMAFFDRDQERLLMADPRSPPGLQFVADTTLSPAARWSIASAALTGFCHNGREILFGIDRRRERLLSLSARALADIPGSGAWIALHRQWLRDGLPLPAGIGSANQTVRVTGIRGFPGRLRFCGAHLPRLSRDGA